MHRRPFQHLFFGLVPVFIFIVVLCAVIVRQKAEGTWRSFLDDRTYADLAVARNLIEKHVYALDPEQPVPAVREVLWRFVVTLTTLLTGDEIKAAYVLGAGFSLMTILFCLRLSHALFPYPPFMMYSTLLLSLAPSLLLTVLDQPSLAMSTALCTAACWDHVAGLSQRQTPLPKRSALFVGLLMWQQLEFFSLWIVFWVHAIILTRLDRERSINTALVVIRGLTGAFFLALCVFPLVSWNVYVIQVPWPQAMGAPSVMDTWLSAGLGESVRSYFSLARGALPMAASIPYATPFLSGLLECVVVWFGILFIAIRAIRRPEERPFTLLLFLLLLMPVCYAFAYPYLGWKAAMPVFSTLTPLCMIMAAFGIFRIPFWIENLYLKWKKEAPSPIVFIAGWMVMGSILLFLSLTRHGSLLSHRNLSLVTQMDARKIVSDAMNSGSIRGPWIVTDQPGWLTYTHRMRVVDLTGEFSPQVLACLDDKGGINASELAVYLAGVKPDSIILWMPENDYVSSLISCVPVVQDVQRRLDRPTLYTINRSVAF